MARPPPPGPGQPPVSFKTVPGRHRTQKWNTARTYDYSGGDWGGYDPYDDYGAEYGDEAPPPMPAQSQGGLPSQQQQQPYGQQGFPRPGRQQSFDEGEERRAFSGPGAFPGARGPSGSPARSAVSGTSSGGRASNDYPRPSTAGRVRDFTNPEQVPPPLNTRASPAPGMTSAPGYIPPPRKSSISGGSPAVAEVPPIPASAPAKEEKELPTIPFIRPSDIYKRMEAERERERKSMDSATRPTMSDLDASTRSSSQQRPLSSVDEDAAKDASPSLPPVQTFSSFGGDMFPGSSSSQPSTADSLQSTPTATRPSAGSDPAADILAERTHDVPVSQIGRQQDALSHQPSSGYRSMVNQAFETSNASKTQSSLPATPASRDGPSAASDVSRSNTTSTSTSGISPIMSHVPGFPVTAPPTIAEEPQQSRVSSESNRIQRKPSPSEREAIVQPGYRRSLDPPSSDNSPARTPGVEDANRGRSLSSGFAAETFDGAPAPTDLPTGGRPRAGTDYSIREADLAREVNASPEKAGFDAGPDAAAAESQRSVQDEYLKNHDPESALPAAAAGVGAAAAVGAAAVYASHQPSSGRESPSKSRVRQIADQYQDLHDTSRRNSQASIGAVSHKSSWSNFRGSDENLPGQIQQHNNDGYQHGNIPQRHATDASNMVSESDYGGVEEGGIRDSPINATPANGEAERPDGFGREASFRPHMPGEWVSTTNVLSRNETPAAGASLTQDEDLDGQRGVEGFQEQRTPRASTQAPLSTSRQQEEPIDLSPTTRKVPLEGSSQQHDTFFDQTKNAGSALGAALMASVGQGHQTRDFGSTQPAQEVEVPSERKTTGDFGYLRTPERPGLNRGETDASVASTVSAASNETVEPTPLAKDAPATVGSEQAPYFGSVAPLRTRGTSPEAKSSTLSPAYYTRPSDGSGLKRDDSTLRREIVRSLDSAPQDDEEDNLYQGDADDVALTQDALDAPENMSRVENGERSLPAAEISDDSPSKPGPLRPLMLDQRFSWENRADGKGALGTPDQTPMSANMDGLVGGSSTTAVPRVQEPDRSPEIKPEMPYERPRSRGLHIMNADDSDDDDVPAERKEQVRDSGAAESGLETGMPVGAAGLAAGGAVLGVGLGAMAATSHTEDDADKLTSGSAAGSSVVSPITKSQENLGSLGDLSVPSPTADDGSLRLPSYYLQDTSGMEFLAPEPTQDGSEAPEPAFGVHDDSRPATRDTADTLPEPTPTSVLPPAPPEKDQQTTPTSPTSKQKIQPFREILALKTPAARIQTYDSTRQTFADMNTGLSDWLSAMLVQNPEYANLSSAGPPPLTSSGTFQRPGHKSSPSLAKFTPKQFGFGSSDPQGSASASAGASGGAGGDGAPKTPVDVEKLQQKGKDLMKGAGVLGGKAQAGAKGLLAKGRSRFGTQRESRGGSGGGSKAPPPSSSDTTSASTPNVSTPPVPEYRQPRPLLAPAPSPAPSSTLPEFITSAAPLAVPSQTSVPSRSQTQTPSSYSTSSRPLSRTFSRLRDRSRSLSRSLSRSKSRPASLILSTTNTNTTNSELRTVEDASPSHLQGPADVDDALADSRAVPSVVSPWSEPDDRPLDFAELTELRSATPARLGVLPSPTAESFAGAEQHGVEHDDVEPQTALPVNEVDDGKLDAVGHGSSLMEAQSRPREGDVRDVPATPKHSIAADEPAGDADNDDELYETTPVAAQTGTGILNKTEDEHAAVDETTPVAAKFGSNASIEDHDEEDLYGATPDAVTRNKPVFDFKPIHGSTLEDSDEIAEQDESNRDSLLTVTAEQDQPIGVKPSAPQLGKEVDAVAPTSGGLDKELPPLPREPNDDDEREGTRDVGMGNLDTTSIISSNEDFHDAQEAAAPAFIDDTHSRRSSVSSLDHVDDEAPVMSSQAVPAGPTSNPVLLAPDDATTPRAQQGGFEGALGDEQRFMSRNYQFGNEQNERPLSYRELGTDETGAPLQETLDTAKASTSAAKVSHSAGAPPTTPPISRYNANRDASSPEDRPKRWSGVVKGRRPTLTSPVVEPMPRVGLAPSQISDQYGLEGLQYNATNVVDGDYANYRDPELVDSKSKRRSSLWDTLKRAPSRSKSKSNVNREISADRVDSLQSLSSVGNAQAASQVRNESPRTGSLKKPQRASTTAAEPESKKKRFSGLGSLFSRSSTTNSRKLEKPQKLSKVPPSLPGTRDPEAQTPATAGPYDAHEASRGQQIPESQPTLPNVHPPTRISDQFMQSRQSETSPGVGAESWSDPPPKGWYAPPENSEIPTYVPPQQQRPQAPQRQLHSERYRVSSAPANRTETYRWDEIPYDSDIPLVGQSQMVSNSGRYPPPSLPPVRSTPPGRGSFSQRPPYSQPPYSQPPNSASYARRHSSYASEEYKLSPQVSGQSEWERSNGHHRGSMPSVSPVQSRTDSEGLPANRTFQVGSISEEVSHNSLFHAPPDQQQTPWAISLPHFEGQQRQDVSIYSQAGENRRLTGQFEVYNQPVIHPPRGVPQSAVTPRSFTDPQGLRDPRVYRDYEQSGMQYENTAYGSPQYPPQPISHFSRPLGRPPHPQQPQQRYYDQPTFQNQLSQPPPKMSYDGQVPYGGPRTSAGYTGRHDDPAVSEEAVVMRGVSYPGQEWSPRGWD